MYKKQNRQILYTAPFWKPLYTCFRAAAHMYIIFQVLRFAQNLQRCARLSPFHRLSLCAPEPRDIALHTVCCNETIYVSLRDATNKMFFFSQKPIYNQSTIGEKRLFLREQKQTACVHRRALRFCTASQNEQPLCIHYKTSQGILAVLPDKARNRR